MAKDRKIRVRHYRGRDNSRAAVHYSEHSRQLPELRDPHLAGYNPGVVREFLGRGRRPLRRHPKPSLAFSKPRFMWRNYSRILNNPRAIEDRPAEM
jgi:hypothetical protein